MTRPTLRVIGLLLIGGSLVGAGVLILVGAGLPDRAETLGTYIFGEQLPVAPEIGALAPPFTAPTLKGESLTLWALRGDVVVLNFWATWCAPCRAELPGLQALYADYAGQGVRVVAVNLGESTAAIQRWVAEFGLTFDIVRDSTGEIVQAYPRYGPPASYVIAPDGAIRHIHFGVVALDDLRAEIDALLRANQTGR